MAELSKLAGISVQEVSGLRGKRGASLAKAGIETVADLLLHVPRRYVDRSRVEPVALLPLGSEVTVIGTVESVSLRRPRRGLTIVEARVSDGTGVFSAVWFNQPFRERQLAPGTEVALSGKVERFRGKLQMNSPDADVLSSSAEALTTGRIVPIHPTAGGVGPGHIRRAMHNALARSRPMPDPIPPEVVERHGLIDRDRAFSDIHFPEDTDAVPEARRRLVFDELFRLEVALAKQKRRQMLEARGVAHVSDAPLLRAFLMGLPYRLTAAQARVLDEIEADMLAEHPMHRLLQGEVGSGKTVVAVATLLRGVAGGWQGAIMAPTEVLAGQHYLGVSGLLALARLDPHGEHRGMESLFAEPEGESVRMALLTSSQVVTNFADGAGREEVLALVAEGKVDLVVGTHALIQEGVHFASLGVAVVDEQHRFGVAQRVSLKEKGGLVDPDLLIMTATPIPRTLSMTLYGDLDVSIIDEMPPGRTPVATRHLSKAQEGEAWREIRAHVAAGSQAFVVCPLVEDSDKIEAASAEAEYRRLGALLTDLRLGLIHGQLPSRDKAAVMAAFRAGDIDVLVATTVIEVGIDVPNATVMVIEDADRFGLSQLHQLRGRVGRGTEGGLCLMLADPTTPEGEARLAAMVATTDGFELAEEDLRIRGQGTVFGTRQSGVADLRLADLLRDFDTLVAARREAFALVDSDPDLSSCPSLRQEIRAMLGDAVEWLFVS